MAALEATGLREQAMSEENQRFSTRRLSPALAIGGSLERAGWAIRVRQFTVRNPRVCSSDLMLVLILTMLVLLSSVLALSLLDRNALR